MASSLALDGAPTTAATADAALNRGRGGSIGGDG